MDKPPLTPKKIQRLINLAEGGSFNIEELLYTEKEVKAIAAQANKDRQGRSPAYAYETSSGILDLDHVEGFGESGSNINVSLGKTSTFNLGEITGRSTGTSEVPTMSGLGVPITEQHGRHSIAIDSVTSQMDKQTSEIQDIMRHSIASNYSFHSKRDLTADEASLIAREAPLPIMHQTHTYFSDNTSVNTSNVSVGCYFGKKCTNLDNIIGKAYSPEQSYMMPSITEVSGTKLSTPSKQSNLIQIDDTLDSVPVRQPRNNDTSNQEQAIASSHTSRLDKFHNPVFKQPARPKPVEKPQATTKVPEKPQHVRALNPTGLPQKSFMSSSKPTDVLLKNLQASFMVNDVTEESVENSLSLSKIADYLGKQSNVSVTDMLQKQKRTKLPLSELHMNTQMPDDLPVTKLIDSKNTETGSSAGSTQTVISIDKLKIHDKIPEVIVTHPTLDLNGAEETKRLTRSKSPSSRSPSTLSTVKDNYSSFKSSKSGDSPTISNEQWVVVQSNPVEGFVGVTTAVTISVTTITDSWLTAKFEFNSLPNEGKDLNVELPRLPLLLSPGKTENFTFHITSNVEMFTVLPFSFYIKDASIDGVVEQNEELQVNFKLPTIQAMSADGINKLLYPAVPEKTALTKTFVLISDCPADLQLKLSITEGDNTFCITSVQEIKRSDVNKVLLEHQGSEDVGKTKTKASNKQLCRLVKDSAIKVSINFNSPKLDMKLFGKSGIMTTYNGMLQVSLISSNTVLRDVNLIGLVGIPKLHVDETANNVQVTNEAAKITVSNRGTVAGTWIVKYRSSNEAKLPFQVTPTRFSMAAEESTTIQVFYVGSPDDGLVQVPIYLEEVSTGESIEVILTGGSDKPKSFPIKSNAPTLSFVRTGRKEISLKNIIDKKVHIRCYIVGEGFSIDMPGGESRGICLLSFKPLECRPLPVVFSPPSCVPHAATLHMALERSNDDTTRKIKLFGCVSAEPVRWSGLVTHSDTAALVRAAGRTNVDLKLHNKSTMPAFVAAHIHFNLQYKQVAPFCHLIGATRIVPGRSFHTISLQVDWLRVERRAIEAATTSLATVTVLTGAETTRRRILKILRDESDGALDASLLPEHLRVLAQQFDGEDAAVDNLLVDFSETRSSLSELIHGGLQELTAHIDLPQDLADDNTIIIADDTILDHHTIIE